MRRFNAIVYDAEIERAIPGFNEDRLPDIEYCKGWTDYEGMGIAVVCAIDLRDGSSHVFLRDNLDDFRELIADVDHVAGFNSINFDDRLLSFHCVPVQTTYDLKKEIFTACGETLRGYKGGRTLDRMCQANGIPGKDMSGAMAPILWQRGEKGKVIDYCLADVHKTARLLYKVPSLIDPVSGQTLEVRPFLAEERQGVLV